MTSTARRLALIAAATTVLAACASPVAPVARPDQLTASSQEASTSGAYAGGVGRSASDSTSN